MNTIITGLACVMGAFLAINEPETAAFALATFAPAWASVALLLRR